MQPKRYALWGLPKGSDDPIDEQLLLSEASAARCDQIEPIAAKDGWHRFRRTVIDDAPPDFTKTINWERVKR